jgi:hypothetical protein
VLALALSTSFTTPAQAQAKSAQAKGAQPAKAGKAAGGAVKRDPNGIKGISPYMEEIAKGRDAFKAKDHSGAIRAFQAAISKDGDRQLGYYMLAQTQLDKGDLDDAVATVEEGSAKKGTEAVQAKMSFLKSELMERKANSKPGEDNAPGSALEAIGTKWQGVKSAWRAYADFVAAHDGAPNYGASASDRQKKIDERVKRDNDFAAVRVRIAADEKQGDKK